MAELLVYTGNIVFLVLCACWVITENRKSVVALSAICGGLNLAAAIGLFRQIVEALP